MAYNEWDPEELLDFNFNNRPKRPEPPRQVDQDEEKRQYEALRQSSKPKREPEEEKKTNLSKAELAAIRKANKKANDRYRSNYDKNVRKSENRKAGKFTKVLSIVYLVVLVAFAATMTIMDVLPFIMLIAFFGILVLLSFIIVLQLRKNNVKTAVRVIASFTAILLIGVYGVGTAYALGTLSFLDKTSVDNPDKVASITKEPFNITMTGIDTKGKIDTMGRSDVNMVVTVNPKTHQILMTSIPRDYQIYMPDKGYALDKITHTGLYGVETTIQSEEDLLATDINYYVKVNFATVQKFIDAIGGIDVNSEYSFNPVKLKSWTVQEGMNHMNGKQALAFARERKAFALGDRQRIKNQQAVFEAMINKATSSRTMVLNYNSIITDLKDYFEMSISSREMRSLIKLQLAENPDWKIFKNVVNGGDGSMATYSTAAGYIMTQDQSSISNAQALIKAVLDGEILEKDKDGDVRVAPSETPE